MIASEALDRLAQLAGIEDGWWDFFGNWRPVSADTKKAFLAAMGFAVESDADIVASLAELENRPWLRWLEPVVVFDETWGDPAITVTMTAERQGDSIRWALGEELGVVHQGQFRFGDLDLVEEREIDGTPYQRRMFHLPGLPPVGYNRLLLTAADGGAGAMVVAVAPAMAYVPPGMDDGNSVWGIATQVYALRTANDWGVGHYGALKDLAVGAARLGAATVGVNPLHALFPDQPEKFSPYSPSSRRFLNTIYIDVEAIPEFAASMQARRLFASPGFQAGLARIKGYPLIEYIEVAQARRPVLEACYVTFRTDHLAVPDDPRGRAFRDFQSRGGRIAELFCTFQALQEKFLKEGNGYWRHWPEAYRHPCSIDVAEFAEENRQRVEFYWWLQFVADEQLRAAHDGAREAGAAVGLYRDLGVGIAGDGAEAWLEQEALALGVSVGAPPDPLALKGQDWGLVPFNPIALREAAYAPFIGVMAANMTHAGALRLDHAMALQRLYWVPAGAGADQGAYVRYPVDDLFRLVALESRRHRCLVIGEDLGTVPEGFRERMDRTAIFAYRVMVFEKTDGGSRFKRPDEFDRQALSIFSTHDLASARGWWNGTDIVKRETLDLYPRPGMAEEERAGRRHDREALVTALAAEGLLEADFPTDGRLDDAQADLLTQAVHEFLSRARSRLMMVQIEDVLGLESQMNLPGTTTEHPNWRVRFPVGVASVLSDPRIRDLADRLKDGRGNR